MKTPLRLIAFAFACLFLLSSTFSGATALIGASHHEHCASAHAHASEASENSESPTDCSANCSECAQGVGDDAVEFSAVSVLGLDFFSQNPQYAFDFRNVMLSGPEKPPKA